MPKKEEKDPLKEWVKTTLWLQVKDGPRIEINVWHPPNIKDKERTALLAKHASQTVKVIWQLRERTPNEMIVQGQYKNEPKGQKENRSESPKTSNGAESDPPTQDRRTTRASDGSSS